MATKPAAHQQELEDTEDPMAVFRRCERRLSGHGLVSPKQELLDLAADTGDDEVADVYGSGALIEDFEQETAQLLGKPAAVFVPSGTMAQQIGLRIWCDRRGCRNVAFHPTCHLEIHEKKGYEYLHGLHGIPVGAAASVIALNDLQAIAQPVGALLLELPQREIGGQLPSWEDLCAQAEWAHANGAALHMDGARLWEAAPYYGRSHAEISALFDSVYVSFYKGIGGIAGAALAGPEDFIAEAKVWIRRHGGNLIHLYPYVLSARSNVRRRLDRFGGYFQRALDIARALETVSGVLIRPNPPQSNMMHVFLRGDRETLLDASRTVAREHGVALFGWLAAAHVPGYCSFELTVGDAVNDLSDEEITSLFNQVMTG